MDWTQAHTICCSPPLTSCLGTLPSSSFCTHLLWSAATLPASQWDARLCTLNLPHTCENSHWEWFSKRRVPWHPSYLNVHNSFILGFLFFSYLLRVKWLIIRESQYQIESFSYLEKHETTLVVPIEEIIFYMEIRYFYQVLQEEREKEEGRQSELVEKDKWWVKKVRDMPGQKDLFGILTSCGMWPGEIQQKHWSVSSSWGTGPSLSPTKASTPAGHPATISLMFCP